MASIADFRARFPEFGRAPDVLVTAHLDAAHIRCSPKRYGRLHTEAVLLTCASMLARSPGARNMRLDSPEQLRLWDDELQRLRAMAAVGFRSV